MNLSKSKILTSNTLKNIAIITMFFDHFFSVFVTQGTLMGSLLRIPGRLAAPIMCYLIAEGVFYTSNLKKYSIRLFIFALISHFPYVIYYNLTWWKATSVIWGLLLGMLALAVVKQTKINWLIKLLAVAVCCVLAYPADWNYVGVLWIVAFGVFRGDFKKQMISFLLIGILLCAIPSVLNNGIWRAYEFATVLAIPVLFLYNGKQGAKNSFVKWGFYVFYPVHLILLILLRHSVGI